jgi:Spy/CpxP family protein refolding chaperone
MKILRLLSTTAAVLLLGAAAVSAQGVKTDESPARAPAAQQSAPAEKMAPEMKPREQKADTKKAPETVGQASDSEKSQTLDKKTPRGAAADVNAKKSETSGENANKETGPSSARSAGEQNRGTTGQGAAAGSTKLTAEQRTKITTIIKQHKVEPARLNVRVSVGTRVPGSVHFYQLPAEVFVVYPEWRGYNYIVVDDQILDINPRTHQIVGILDA